MSIGVEIQVKLKAGEDTYAVNLKLPSEAPSKENPFLFRVVPLVEAGEGTAVLEVAVVDATNIYVGIAPPEQLMASSGVTKVVESLKVVVAEGNYDPVTCKFI